MIRRARFIWGLTFLFHVLPAAAQPPAERDWSAALREDAQALHDDIATNHPGPVNSEDPEFAARNDRQLALALSRARDARSYGDYFFALREYVASFNDGHMGFGASGDTPNDFRWPGFLTRYNAHGDVKVVVSDEPLVPVGATLLGCDGMTADEYGAATLGQMWGRWHLASQRLNFGGFLFLSEGSRYVPHAKRCRFEAEGRRAEVTLDWRPARLHEVLDRLQATSPQAPRNFGGRTLSDGTQWYSLPSFNADPRSSAGKALPIMIADMRSARAKLASASAIVLDLRGNGGGSSDWSRQIAEVLWGTDALQRLPATNVHVDWRVSRANLESLEQSYAHQKTGGGLSPEMRHWFETVIAGMSAALARGDALWRHPKGGPEQDTADAAQDALPPPPLLGPVYFTTDANCGSACLDAVDLWRALGAIHVGQTTSADTLYMDVRQRGLPSGITSVSMPMKVYRGRPRGSNEPVVPVHKFDGDIADTAALERWVATLR